MADHLNAYVSDFTDKFEIMYDHLKFGKELKEGTYRYSFSINYLAELEKFLHYKLLTLTNAGHLWTGQDIHVIDPTYNIGLSVIVSYNEIQEVFSFMAQAYFFMHDFGRFDSFSSYDDALQFSKRIKTQDMMYQLS